MTKKPEQWITTQDRLRFADEILADIAERDRLEARVRELEEGLRGIDDYCTELRLATGHLPRKFIRIQHLARTALEGGKNQ